MLVILHLVSLYTLCHGPLQKFSFRVFFKFDVLPSGIVYLWDANSNKTSQLESGLRYMCNPCQVLSKNSGILIFNSDFSRMF